MLRGLSSQARLLILFGLSLGLGLVFNYLFYDKLPGISFLVFIASNIFGLWLVARSWDMRFPRSAWVTIIASLFFAAMLAVRANPFLGFLNVVASFYLLGISVVIIAGGFRWEKLRSFVSLVYLPIKFLGRVTWSISRFTEFRSPKEKGISHQVFRGILMALPVLFLFTLLFASADLVIRDYLLRVFQIENLPEALGRTILVLVISIIATGMFGYVLSRMAKDDNDSADAAEALASRNPRKVSKVQISVFLGAIAVLFLIFICVQGLYFFGGDAALAGQNFTYAEYARRGFFELLAVALITFVLLWASERSVLRDGDRHSRQFKAIASLLVLEVLLIISSAFLRLGLYEDAFGFTTLRLWSHAFTIWLVVAFGLFTWKILHDRDDKAFLVPAFASLMLALAMMNALNPDVFIARKNIERFSAGERFDASYISSLSDDAMPQMLAAFDGLQGEEKLSVAGVLSGRYKERSFEEYTSWQSFNLARKEAAELLSSRSGEIEKYYQEAGEQELSAAYQTYRDEHYGIEFNYPPTWKAYGNAKAFANPDLLSWRGFIPDYDPNKSDEEQELFGISIFNKNPNSHFDAPKRFITKIRTDEKWEQVTVNGYAATKITSAATNQVTGYVFDHEGRLYVLEATQPDLFEKILPTLRFF